MYDSNVQVQIERYWSYKQTIPNYDNIRFQPYRIACKLRHLQKESKFYLIDLFNTIEAFREFGLNSYLDLNALIPNQEINSIIYSIFHQLSRRVPSSQDIDTNYSVIIVYNWLLETFKDAPDGFINVLAFKIALTLLCSSLFSNKLKYIFTLLSNENGFLDESSFAKFMRYISYICNYFENDCMDFDGVSLQRTFNFSTLVDLKQFIETLTNFENQNELISWMVVYHRLFDSEKVTHDIPCNSCDKNSFTGFRYKCKICHNYNQCQDCFWTGRSSKNHDPDFHPSKEYLFDNTKNHLRRSFRKSFRKLLPKQEISSTSNLRSNDNLIVKRLNLSNIISPQVFRKNRSSNTNEFKFNDFCSEYSELSNSILSSDCEHQLIEHYLNILKNESNNNARSVSCFSFESTNEFFEKQILELERKNRELMKSILELNSREQNHNQQNDYNHISKVNDGTFFVELSLLRQKKADLEEYLSRLQDRRKKLMFQLDDLMKELQECNLSNESRM